jgi:hypothetical protein
VGDSGCLKEIKSYLCRLGRSATACLEQDGGKSIDRMGIDTALSSIDFLDVLRIDDLTWRPLGMNLPFI